MKTKISELDNEKFIELWNNTKLSNAEIAKKLGCGWSLIKIKLRANKTVAAACADVIREGGLSGEAASSGKKSSAAPKSSAKKASTKKTTKVVKEGSEEAASEMKQFQGQFAVTIDKTEIKYNDSNDLLNKIEGIMRDRNLEKVDLIREGRYIELANVQPGDRISLGVTVSGAGKFTITLRK